MTDPTLSAGTSANADVVVEPFGDAALRARLPGGVNAAALLRELRTWPRVVDAIVTEHHALVTWNPAAPPDDAAAHLAAAIAQAKAWTENAVGAVRTHTIPVRYDGEDLDDVGRATGLDRPAIIALHTGATYTVATLGFLPGFAYLRGLDARLVLPRRPTPRPRVPALSVAIAGPYAGVYPLACPGGWHLLGTAVGFAPFDPTAGAAVALGDRVVFVESRA